MTVQSRSLESAAGASRFKTARFQQGHSRAVLPSSVALFSLVAHHLRQDDQSGFDVNVWALEGTSLEATGVMANRIGAAIRRIPEVGYMPATVAGDGAGHTETGRRFS